MGLVRKVLYLITVSIIQCPLQQFQTLLCIITHTHTYRADKYVKEAEDDVTLTLAPRLSELSP